MGKNNNELDNLVDEIGMIDDDIIESSIKCNSTMKKLVWKKYVSIAACFIVICTISILFFKTNFNVFDEVKDGQTPQFYGGNDENIYSKELLDDNSEYHFYGDNSKDYVYGDNSLVLGEKDEASENDIEKEEISGVEDGKDEDPDNFGDSTSPYPPSSNSPSQIVPPLNNIVEIDNFSKLAYYSGWSILRQNDLDLLSSVEKNSCLQLLSKENVLNDIYFYGEDVYINEVYNKDTSANPDIIDKYEGNNSNGKYENLIPIDPGYSGEIYAYAIYEIKIKSVKYFRISIEDKCYLADKIGAGDSIEVMILDLVITNAGDETMIVLKNGENFYSCLCDSMYINEDNKSYKFTPSKYISYFSIVKIPELSKHDFYVDFQYNNEKIEKIVFKATNEIQTVVVLETYHSKECDKVYTAFGLTEELYRIYLQDVAAGVIQPVMPEVPSNPNYNNESVFIGTFEVENTFATNLYDEKQGFLCFENSSKLATEVIESFNNSYLKEMIESYPETRSLTLVWVKGTARLSAHNIIHDSGKVLQNVEYFMFNENSSKYTIFLFEGTYEVSLCEVDYSTSVVTNFEAKSDSYERFMLNLYADETYKLFINDTLVYTGGYKLSNGMICLTEENDTKYIPLESDGSFVYKGMKFKLL